MDKRFPLSAVVSVAVSLVLVGGVAGCGQSDRVALFPVSGKVLVRGKPAPLAVVTFVPKVANPDAKGLVHRATADEQGRYQLSTFDVADGAPAGEYNVSIVWHVGDLSSNDPEQRMGDGDDKLQGKYADPNSSGLSAVVAPQSNELKPFELK